MDDKLERQQRRKAMRWRLQGIAPKVILEKLHRSWAWLSKWQKRYDHEGFAGLRSRSRRPKHSPTACSPSITRLIVRIRRRLTKQKIGLVGADTIRRELHKLGLDKQLPSPATIQRILKAQCSPMLPRKHKPAYFPHPLLTLTGTLQAQDWTCHYLEGGLKVYAFHSLNLRTRACAQTIATDKNLTTVWKHCAQTWKTLGIPCFLQLDNDAVFCGGYKIPRVFSQFVRLCLYLGIQLIFLPFAEPERNGAVEELNGLWGKAFWMRHHFHSVGQVCRASPKFVDWYLTDYAPPYLNGLTPQQAQQAEPKRRLYLYQWAYLPARLPITAGRIHFIRLVRPDGTIAILNEVWKVGKRWAGKYVWATIITHRRRLEIWYQRSAQHAWRLLKVCRYDLPEKTVRLRPEFAPAPTT